MRLQHYLRTKLLILANSGLEVHLVHTNNAMARGSVVPDQQACEFPTVKGRARSSMRSYAGIKIDGDAVSGAECDRFVLGDGSEELE